MRYFTNDNTGDNMEPTKVATLIAIFTVIFAVITICVPFYILKIRNQVVDMNKKMAVMNEYLKKIAGQR